MTAFILFYMFGIIVFTIEVAAVKMNILTTMAEDIQTDLILSNSAVYKHIDKKALGDLEPKLIISDYTAAYNGMKEYLIYNMELSNNLEPKSDAIIKGPIEIKDFIIYNIKGDKVDIVTLRNGAFNVETKGISELVVTPNNHVVTSTTVTTTIEMDIQNMFGRVERQSISVDTDLIDKK
ncbi:MAG: hypothetical protein RSA57_03685 [Cetobacterium sp.]